MLCPACGRPETRRFLEIESTPVLCNLLSPSREQALRVYRGRIDLGLCRACGLIANESFDPAALAYGGRYENALHFSPSFRGYVEDLARDLAARYSLSGKRAVEIGAGDGYFLSALCKLGGCTGEGYDPSFTPGRSMIEEGSGAAVHPEMFEPRHAAGADLVVCRHVLEHLPRPLEFLGSLRESLPEGAPVFFEVPDADYMLREGAVWDVLYEHCSYFGARPLRLLFERAGFRVDRTANPYGGQFLTIEARAAAPIEPAHAPIHDEPAAAFAETYRAKVSLWARRLERLGPARVALWGAGTKGVCFLNALGEAGAAIAAVVDLNPRKWSHFTAGTGHEIVAPERLRELRPQLVIVANPLYRGEISDTLSALGVSSELAVL